ncbi:hypothetical protein AB4144_33445, partial [Rhizobiaceae sp. 2RAB30]
MKGGIDLVQERPAVAAPCHAGIRQRCQRHADDVDEDGYFGAFLRHLAADDLDRVGKIIAVQLWFLEHDNSLLE